jgi:hypothetical protein
MKNYTELSLENLQLTSKNWDGYTKDLLLFIEGWGNVCGNSSRYVHVILHGKNSGTETGTIEVKGVAISDTNIARGTNGNTYQVVSYYKDKTDFKDMHNAQPTYKARIDGACVGGEMAICTILRAEIDWIIENN